MEQTIVDLGRQITELAAEIESWKFWLTLIVGIAAFVVALGCVVIPAFIKAASCLVSGTSRSRAIHCITTASKCTGRNPKTNKNTNIARFMKRK